MAIYTRLKDLREDADKTQSDVARYLGTTAQYYGKYEKGERELPFDRAIRLAEYYNVTLDYLAGRSNNKLGQPLTDDEASLLKKWHSQPYSLSMNSVCLQAHPTKAELSQR